MLDAPVYRRGGDEGQGGLRGGLRPRGQHCAQVYSWYIIDVMGGISELYDFLFRGSSLCEGYACVRRGRGREAGVTVSLSVRIGFVPVRRRAFGGAGGGSYVACEAGSLRYTRGANGVVRETSSAVMGFSIDGRGGHCILFSRQLGEKGVAIITIGHVGRKPLLWSHAVPPRMCVHSNVGMLPEYCRQQR